MARAAAYRATIEKEILDALVEKTSGHRYINNTDSAICGMVGSFQFLRFRICFWQRIAKKR